MSDDQMLDVAAGASPNRMTLFLIDAIGPFFRDDPRCEINWSKIPFSALELEGDARRRQFTRIAADLDRFAQRVGSTGFNAASLDDLAHLTDHEWYEPDVRRKICVLQQEFHRLFAVLKKRGLNVFVTMDVVSFTPALKARIGHEPARVRAFLCNLIDCFFDEFPEVDGLIVRIGECDGKDVRGAFKSELHLRRPAQVNRFVRALLPVFERHRRLMIFRTWTVGAHRVGDLLWHRKTFTDAFDGIDSDAFVLSMKYGESDFFRYLPLNSNFFRTQHKKIVELQARREYEGCGEYPSFIGWDYEQYAAALRRADNLIGISVWCQTGGWVPFRRLTFLQPEAVWNEINTFVTLRIFRDRQPVEEAVFDYARCNHFPDAAAMLELLTLSDEVIKELLYIEQYARRKLFFRRVRIPPLLAVYWHNILINRSVRLFLHYFVEEPEKEIERGYAALEKLERMKELAKTAGLPADDIDFMSDTFRILALAREYYFLPKPHDAIEKRLLKAKKRYKKRYPKNTRHRYRIKINFGPFHLRPAYLHWFFQLAMRRQRGYRLIDRVLTLYFLSLLYRFAEHFRPHWIPKFARKTAMGIESVFR